MPEEICEFTDVFSVLVRKGCKIVKSPYPHPLKEKQLLEIIPEIDAAITGLDEFTVEVIEAAQNLKVISKYGVGTENIDVEAATNKGIVIAYSPNQNAVADFTLAMMLCLARRICEGNMSVKMGIWKKPTGTDVWGKTLGVIGAGRIGRTVVERVKGFNMKVLVYDVRRDVGLAKKLGFEYTSLQRLLEEADFVTIHVPLNTKTKGLIGEREIGLMKPSAYLINTAREGIVDDEALYLALKDRRVAGAAFDAPLRRNLTSRTSLLRLDNVIATPHMAANSQETLKDMALVTVQNVLRVLNEKKPLHALRPSVTT